MASVSATATATCPPPGPLTAACHLDAGVPLDQLDSILLCDVSGYVSVMIAAAALLGPQATGVPPWFPPTFATTPVAREAGLALAEMQSAAAVRQLVPASAASLAVCLDGVDTEGSSSHCGVSIPWPTPEFCDAFAAAVTAVSYSQTVDWTGGGGCGGGPHAGVVMCLDGSQCSGA